MRKSGIIVTLLGGAAVIAAAVTGSADERVPTGASERSARASAPAPALGTSPAPLGLDLQIGTEHLYDISFAQAVQTETASSPDFTVALDGAWAVAYAGRDDRGLVFRAQLRDGRPAVRRGDADASAAFSETLRRPYYFTTTPEGRLIELHFGADLDEVAKLTLATLASTFQVSTHGHAETWEAVESDGIGDYRARYVRRGALRRERVAYDRVAGGAALAATVVETGTDIALRADGWPERIAGTEVTRIGTNELGVIVRARFAVRHRAIARGVEPGWYDDMPGVAADAIATTASQEQADRDLVGGASLADLLAELARIDDDHARGYQFLRLAALFRLDADAARAGARLVVDGALDADAASAVIGALGEAGTPTAQRALGDVLAAPLGEDTRARAAIALGLTEAPTGETLAALATAAATGEGDVATTATLAQGNAALRMHDDAPAAAAQQVDALLARLAAAGSDEERALVIRALGNTGDPRIVPALDPFLTAGSSIVRIAATEALRLVPGAAVDGRILARLGDGDGIVRAAAVFAAGERDLRAFAAGFDRVLRSDSEIEVRRAIVGLAGARLTELPALRALVEYAAAHDADPELRAAAKDFLAQPS